MFSLENLERVWLDIEDIEDIKNKYNIENRPFETQSWSIENNFKQTQVSIVSPSTTEGVRKAGRFTITLANTQVFPYWALLYVPEGGTTTGLFPDSNTLVNPSNYVLASVLLEILLVMEHLEFILDYLKFKGWRSNYALLGYKYSK